MDPSDVSVDLKFNIHTHTIERFASSDLGALQMLVFVLPSPALSSLSARVHMNSRPWVIQEIFTKGI